MLSACKDTFPEEEPVPPKLEAEGDVTTDKLTFSFNILKCRGNFSVEVSTADGGLAPQVNIEGYFVTVELVSEFTTVKVTDETHLTSYLRIRSTHPYLVSHSYQIEQAYGATYRYPDIQFGVKPLRLLTANSENKAVYAYIDAEGNLTAKSQHSGRATFLLADARGTVRRVTFEVRRGWDLTTDKLTVECTPGQYINFALKYGQTGWQLASAPNESPFNLILPKGNSDNSSREQDLLQIHIPAEAENSLTYRLKNKNGLAATITVNIIKTTN